MVEELGFRQEHDPEPEGQSEEPKHGLMEDMSM